MEQQEESDIQSLARGALESYTRYGMEGVFLAVRGILQRLSDQSSSTAVVTEHEAGLLLQAIKERQAQTSMNAQAPEEWHKLENDMGLLITQLYAQGRVGPDVGQRIGYDVGQEAAPGTDFGGAAVSQHRTLPTFGPRTT